MGRFARLAPLLPAMSPPPGRTGRFNAARLLPSSPPSCAAAGAAAAGAATLVVGAATADAAAAVAVIAAGWVVCAARALFRLCTSSAATSSLVFSTRSGPFCASTGLALGWLATGKVLGGKAGAATCSAEGRTAPREGGAANTGALTRAKAELLPPITGGRAAVSGAEAGVCVGAAAATLCGPEV